LTEYQVSVAVCKKINLFTAPLVVEIVSLPTFFQVPTGLIGFPFAIITKVEYAPGVVDGTEKFIVAVCVWSL